MTHKELGVQKKCLEHSPEHSSELISLNTLPDQHCYV